MKKLFTVEKQLPFFFLVKQKKKRRKFISIDIAQIYIYRRIRRNNLDDAWVKLLEVRATIVLQMINQPEGAYWIGLVGYLPVYQPLRTIDLH